MKATNGHREQQFQLHCRTLLLRLQRAGLIRHFEEPGAGPLQIEWNRDDPAQDGLFLFGIFATVLRRLTTDSFPSEDELALVEILRQEMFGVGGQA